MKPVEIVLRREGGRKEEGEQWRGVSLNKIYCKPIYKYHNVSPCTTIIS
jgi:hypothetical protein